MSATAVPKPATAGTGRTAIADTVSSYVNVRSGPGTNYADIGDVRDKTLLVYYPNSRTSSGWVWIEQRGLGGWVSGSVIAFEDVVAETPTSRKATPYDGKVAIWHWKGSSIPETSIEQFAASLRQRAPNVKQVWVKTSDGSDWQGRFDNSALAINNEASVDRWVQVLEQNGLEFHAWCVPKGVNIDAEAAVISVVCNRPGVKSMILDVEPYTGFWEGGRSAVRPLMLKIRQSVPSGFHIGMSMDPRPWHYDSIFPDEWFPFINSVHPQAYWYTFRRTVDEVLQQTYDTWGGYGHPIIPALQGDAPVSDQQDAITLVTNRHGAQGISWWRYGVISSYTAVNTAIDPNTPTDPTGEPNEHFTDEVIILPGGDGFRSGSYTGRNEFQQFTGVYGWNFFYKSTESNTSKVWAEWKTDLPESGTYQISTFVPGLHATTQKARFKIHGIKGTDTEVVVEIDQSKRRNVWVSLGIFELVKGAPNAGKVFLNDVTHEVGKEIAFDAIRWRRIVSTGTPTSPPPSPPPPPATGPGPDVINGVYVANGYDSPIGTTAERAGDRVWPSGWRDATGFGSNTVQGYINTYRSYHTGVDLNVGSGPYDDRGVAVYSPASGVVIYQADLTPWGNVTIIRHDPLLTPGGAVYYSRFGHMQNVRVQVGQRVTRGQQVGEIGDGGGRFIPHLHFDISSTTVLELKPGDWPGMDLARLLKNYVDPLAFIRNNRP